MSKYEEDKMRVEDASDGRQSFKDYEDNDLNLADSKKNSSKSTEDAT
jgi:hypothetical protein